ncbi:MAG TPA: hypothetical protein DD435_16485 [Cyanobacteria bacterium UBA8530]|nr:hypothetical protein [Cyanobacteria bacterium UBA8530]
MQPLKKKPSLFSIRNRLYVTAIVAATIQFISVFLQYATGALDGSWGYLFPVLNLGAALMLFLGILSLPRDRTKILAIAGAVYLTVTSLLVIGVKLSFRPSLEAAKSYTLPLSSYSYELPHRRVTLLTSDGVRLRGIYLGQKRPAAILIYPGWLSKKESFSLVTLAEWLFSRYDVLVMDPRGQGESGGAQDVNAKFDLLAGVAFLRSEGALRVGVLAETDGAYPAILAAGEQRVIDCLALASPVGRWGPPSLGEGFWRDPGNFIGRWYWRLAADVRLRGGASQPTAEVIGKVSPIPLLLMESMRDSQRIASQLHLVAKEPRSLILLPGEGHPVDWPHFDKYLQAVSQWFNLTLSDRAPALPGTEATPSLTP